MPADVHVVRRGIAAQHVVVDRGDLDAVLDQLGHDRVDLGVEQHESPMTIAPPWAGLNAVQPPSAKAGGW
jgi:hypothetical protein